MNKVELFGTTNIEAAEKILATLRNYFLSSNVVFTAEYTETKYGDGIELYVSGYGSESHLKSIRQLASGFVTYECRSED